jgi:hypothetical protein
LLEYKNAKGWYNLLGLLDLLANAAATVTLATLHGLAAALVDAEALNATGGMLHAGVLLSACGAGTGGVTHSLNTCTQPETVSVTAQNML